MFVVLVVDVGDGELYPVVVGVEIWVVEVVLVELLVWVVGTPPHPAPIKAKARIGAKNSNLDIVSWTDGL
jgi:hypothetical protein